MHAVGAFALWLTQAPLFPPNNPLPPWIGAASVSSLFAWLWWTERADRKEAERLTREVYKESTQRLTDGLVTIDRTIDFVEKKVPPDRRGR